VGEGRVADAADVGAGGVAPTLAIVQVIAVRLTGERRYPVKQTRPQGGHHRKARKGYEESEELDNKQTLIIHIYSCITLSLPYHQPVHCTPPQADLYNSRGKVGAGKDNDMPEMTILETALVRNRKTSRPSAITACQPGKVLSRPLRTITG
jgi:hypothetical protein